jgi:hypothetical protein
VSTKIADVLVALGLDSSAYDSGMSAAHGRASAFGGVLTGIFQGIGQRLFTGIVDGLETVVQKMGNAVQASSNLNESINKTGVVFGSSAQAILDWSATSDRSLGLSQQKALEAASSFGALFKQMGQGPATAAALSEELVKISADLGSINNIDPAIALEKLQSGLQGETRPLRDLNIFLNENVVAQKAVQLGLAASTDAVSDQAKVMARYALIVEQSKYAQGDFARTSGDLANAQRILGAELEDGAAKLGNVFRPAITAITNTLIDIAPQMFDYAANIMDQFAAGIAAGINALLPVIQTVTQLFSYWFAPGSPPRVLPNIDKWGAAAMGQFLSGFASIDVKDAFAGIGSAIESILRSDVSAGKGSETGLVNRIFGTQAAIKNAVTEFAQVGSVSESSINRIVQSAGTAGKGIGELVRAYFNLQTATSAATRAQDDLNRITERYDAILSPLQGELDSVRAQQQALADQQRLIAARNTLANFDATEADKQAARLEIQQISLESQISGVEQQKKAETDKAQAAVDSTKIQQDAAQKQMDAAQATLDQQVQHNNLLGEQRQLEARLAQQQESDAKRAESAAEQAANKAKQQAEQAQRLADQLHTAQLDYNLSLADTAGKIALWQGELAKTTPGTAEYFQILTKIHELTVSLAKENAKAGAVGGGIGGALTLPNLANVPKPGSPSAGAQALVDSIKAAQEALSGGGKGDVPAWMVNLKKFLTEDFPAAFKPVLKAIEDLVATIKLRFPEIQNDTSQTLGVMAKLWQEHGDLVNSLWSLLWKEIGATAEFGVNLITGLFTTFVGAITLNWQTFTKGLGEIWAAFWTYGATLGETEATRIRLFLDEFFPGALGSVRKFVTDSITAIEGLYTGFKTAGEKMVSNLLGGLQSKWGELTSWFTSKLSELTAKLPFSEPKDSSSPLRNLPKAGESIIGQIQSGMTKASLSIQPFANNLLAAGVTTNNSTANSMHFTINISGGGNAEVVGKGAKDGVLQALRAVGMA